MDKGGERVLRVQGVAKLRKRAHTHTPTICCLRARYLPYLSGEILRESTQKALRTRRQPQRHQRTRGQMHVLTHARPGLHDDNT